MADAMTRVGSAALTAIALDIHALVSRIERATGVGLGDVDLALAHHERVHYLLQVWLQRGYDRSAIDMTRARGYIELLTDEDPGVRWAVDALLRGLAMPGRERLARRLADQPPPPAGDRLH